MRSLIILIVLSLSFPIMAQNQPETQLTLKMDQGVELMNAGKYEEADDLFLYVIKNMTALPSDLAYYFGANSYQLSKYKQSINWLNKYIQLKGTSGRFYEEAVKYLKLSEDQYLELSRATSKKLQEELSGDEYDCGGLSKMICPVCKGQGVILKKGDFETIYQTCPYSAGEPYLTCEEYNLFMTGKLEPKL